MTDENKYFVLKLETFEGEDTYIHCGDDCQDYLFCVVVVCPDGTTEIIDNGYRSKEEALEAWPEARPNP